VATQDPELRKRFTGKPEYLVNFMKFIAQELREHMAELGFRTVDEMVGRVDMIENMADTEHWKAKHLDFSALLSAEHNQTGEPVRCTRSQDHGLDTSLDHELMRLAEPALERSELVRVELPVRNVHRTVSTILSNKVATTFGAEGLPEDTIDVRLTGSAGQSLGAFLAPGVALRIEGDTNDYVGKGLSGGKIIVVPPTRAAFVPHENIIVGNACLYGATEGEAYIYGLAGERFGIRNSGVKAVVEGVGDHGCEYMTGGVVVVLGPTGYNFAAGMSGGTAYVYNDSGLFDTRCNLDMVDLESVWTEEDKTELRTMIEAHVQYTGSARAQSILDNWEACLPLFVKVMPIDYRKSLERMRLSVYRDMETVAATEEVYNG